MLISSSVFLGNMMAKYSTNEFRPGLKILVDGEPWSIVEKEFHKPGKGQAVMRAKIKHCKTGRVIDRTYKTGESVEAAQIEELEMSFLFRSGDVCTFMHPETYDQIEINVDVITDISWIKEGAMCKVVLWNDHAIGVEVPNFVELAVIQCEPGLKGDTASGGSKVAELETGASLRVPLFVNIGDIVRVNTRDKVYDSRIKSK